MTDDRFEAAGIRHRVLTSWSASAARFREDANAEEDLVLGGYRDRVIVELAQNAADAALRAGKPGRLLLALRESVDAGQSGAHAVLVAANTGTALDAAGVQALATLRASAKRDGDTIGRFGVGFAAVLAISDEPAVISRSGGVRFSAADTRELVRTAAQTAPELAEELLRRDGHVPVLRLPFAAEGTPPDGYDTAVLLPLRDLAAEDLVLRLLDEVADPLLLALPALTEIIVERPGRPTVVLRDAAERWRVLRREGRLPAEVLATRPTEERSRSRWSVTWALPRAEAHVPGVVHAPTPSDEPLPWPALLIATLPLDPSRRHLAPGPVADALVLAAAEAYVDLLVERAAAGDPVWPLIVTGLPVGPLDADLRAAVKRLLPAAPILQSAEDPALRLRPRDALALTGPVGADPQTVAGFASWLAGLVLAPRAATAVFELLGVRRISLADAVETLPAVADPVRWRQVYTALAPLAGDASVREALAFLPVPLTDGTVVRGMRGLLLAPPSAHSADFPDQVSFPGQADSPDQIELTAALAVLGARVVHPDAVHPLLERLGAIPAGPRALLELPAVRATVRGVTEGEGGDLDGPSDEQVVDAVLTLVAAAVRAGELQPGDLPWLGDLALADDTGDLTPAAALALPESLAAYWFSEAEIGIVETGLVARWGVDTLTAVGVLQGPGLVRGQDVPIEPGFEEDRLSGPAAELDAWDDWLAMIADELDGMPPGAVLSELVAVRDLDAVRRDALPDVVAAIAADPVLRRALVAPARIVADGRPFDVPSYTAWWLRTELSASPSCAAPDADPELRALLPAAPEWVTRLDPTVQRALGVLTKVNDLDPTAVPTVLDRLADAALDLPPEWLIAVFAKIAVLAENGLEVDRPDQVRALSGNSTAVVPADQVVVIEAPMYRQRTDLGLQLPVAPQFAAALADLLDLPLAGELAAGVVAEEDAAASSIDPTAGQEQSTANELLRLLPEAPTTWCEHDQLLVDGFEVDWWVTGEGPEAAVHAATTDGLALGLAWAARRWELRGLVADLLAEPEIVADVMIDQVFSAPQPTRSPAAP
ncbi:MAG TPA: hypothetical protein VLL08_30235 [Kineosporiaceae bacterium]|nr:hypothetical protein [Kineosporiaceae bacterium]